MSSELVRINKLIDNFVESSLQDGELRIPANVDSFELGKLLGQCEILYELRIERVPNFIGGINQYYSLILRKPNVAKP